MITDELAYVARRRTTKLHSVAVFVLGLALLAPSMCSAQSQVRNSFGMIAKTLVQSEQIVYSNSFESLQDTVGLRGYGWALSSGDVPEGGGHQCLRVSGGCIWPHALIELPADSVGGVFLLRCWGKNLQIGGYASILVNGDYSPEVSVSVTENEWTFYQSPDTLYCPAGKSILLQMGAGGYVPSAMLVDLVEIVRLDVVVTSTRTPEIEESVTFSLSQNFPNPFNSSTLIQFSIPQESSNSQVDLSIHNVLGQTVRVVVHQRMAPGTHTVQWDGSADNRSTVPSGIYFYTLRVGGRFHAGKMNLVK